MAAVFVDSALSPNTVHFCQADTAGLRGLTSMYYVQGKVECDTSMFQDMLIIVQSDILGMCGRRAKVVHMKMLATWDV